MASQAVVAARRSRGVGYQLAGITDRQGDAPQTLIFVGFHSPPFGVALAVLIRGQQHSRSNPPSPCPSSSRTLTLTDRALV